MNAVDVYAKLLFATTLHDAAITELGALALVNLVSEMPAAMKVVATVVGVKVAVKVASSVHLWPVRKRSDAHQGRTRKAGRVDSRRQRVPGGDGVDGGSEAPKRLTDGRARHGRLLLAARHATTGVITHFKCVNATSFGGACSRRPASRQKKIPLSPDYKLGGRAYSKLIMAL